MKQPIELTVPVEAAGERLDSWLASVLPGHSRSAVARLISQGLVELDGATVRRSRKLVGGELISVGEPEAAPPREATAEGCVVHEDDHVLVVDKPAGLVVHPAPGHDARTLVDQLAERARGAYEPLLVHRLDRDTSGLLLVAKDKTTCDELQAQLQARTLEREYIGLALGHLRSRTGTIDAPIGRDRTNRARMSTDTATPRDAITHFEIERFAGPDTLLRLRLETGRTHQIRAHLAAIGHPVCGDPEYGGAGGTAQQVGLKRQFLHSARIAYTEPATGKRREFSSPLPPDLQQALDQLPPD